jgi:hypothetical protein
MQEASDDGEATGTTGGTMGIRASDTGAAPDSGTAWGRALYGAENRRLTVNKRNSSSAIDAMKRAPKRRR